MSTTQTGQAQAACSPVCPEEGKKYLTRDGRLVKILEIKRPVSAKMDSPFYAYGEFLTGNQLLRYAWWELDGRFDKHPNADLVGEIE